MAVGIARASKRVTDVSVVYRKASIVTALASTSKKASNKYHQRDQKKNGLSLFLLATEVLERFWAVA